LARNIRVRSRKGRKNRYIGSSGAGD